MPDLVNDPPEIILTIKTDAPQVVISGLQHFGGQTFIKDQMCTNSQGLGTSGHAQPVFPCGRFRTAANQEHFNLTTTRLVPEQPRRNNLGIIDNQHISWAKTINNIDKLSRSNGTCLALNRQQPRSIAANSRRLSDQFLRQGKIKIR